MSGPSTDDATGEPLRTKRSGGRAGHATGKSSAKTKSTAKKKTASKKTTSRKRSSAAPKANSLCCTLVSVFGPFNSRMLIEMPAEFARLLFQDIGDPIAPTRVIDAVQRDLDDIRERKSALADSQLAATAVALAYELEDPYNSATSKSMCARALNETMGLLRELAPPKREADGIDRLEQQRTKRRDRVSRKTGTSA